MEPAVLVEHEPEVPVTSGPAPPAAAVEAGTAAGASADTAEEAGTEAGTAGAAGVEGECCCRKQQGQSSSSCPPSLGACAQCSMSPALSAIQCLEGRLLQTGLIAVVIRKLSQG